MEPWPCNHGLIALPSNSYDQPRFPTPPWAGWIFCCRGLLARCLVVSADCWKLHRTAKLRLISKRPYKLLKEVAGRIAIDCMDHHGSAALMGWLQRAPQAAAIGELFGAMN